MAPAMETCMIRLSTFPLPRDYAQNSRERAKRPARPHRTLRRVNADMLHGHGGLILTHPHGLPSVTPARDGRGAPALPDTHRGCTPSRGGSGG